MSDSWRPWTKAKGADPRTPLDQLHPDGHQVMEREPLFDSDILALEWSSDNSSTPDSCDSPEGCSCPSPGGCSSPKGCLSPEGCLSPVLMKDAATQTDSETYELALHAFPYVCRLCPRRFETKINLIFHEAMHTGPEESTATQPVTHGVCDDTPNNQKETQTKKICFSPKECSVILERVTESPSNARREESHSPPQQCVVRVERMKVPMAVVSCGNRRIKFLCEQCSASFSEQAKLHSHVLQAHMTKSGYMCDHCSKCFRKKSLLSKHIISHMDVRPFLCNFCPAQFKRNRNLRRHIRDIHERKNEVKASYSYTCDHCSKCFRIKSDLSKHIISHMDVRPFVCKLCPAQFKRNYNLLGHIRNTHERKNNVKAGYTCDHCSKCFRMKSRLREHIIWHHMDVWPFACNFCPADFKLNSNLRRHIRDVHERKNKVK
nr:PREDICTED: zinc finger protein 567-like [Bemisia tabaci]